MHFTPARLTRPEAVLTREGLACFGGPLRGLYIRLPLLAAYLCAVAVLNILRFWAVLTVGQRSKSEFNLHRTRQWILVLLRAALNFGLCRQMLGRYAGFWKLSIRILSLAGVVLICRALFDMTGQGSLVARFFLPIDRRWELTVSGVPVVVSSFCHYYRIRMDRPIGLEVLGIRLGRGMGLLSDTFANQWFKPLPLEWREMRGDCFILAEFVWLTAIALGNPLQEQKQSPVLGDSRGHAGWKLVVTNRLRDLNTHFEEILG